MKAQKDIETGDELRKWAQEIRDKFPLPETAQWVVVTEESPLFVRTVVNG